MSSPVRVFKLGGPIFLVFPLQGSRFFIKFALESLKRIGPPGYETVPEEDLKEAL